MPTQGKLSYRQQTKDCSCECRDCAASFQISKPSLSDIGTSSGSLACAPNMFTCNLDLETGMNLWNWRVPFTVLANSNLAFSSVSDRATSSGGTLKNLIPWMFSLQKLIIASDSIWSLYGRCKLAFVTSRFTVPPMPSQALFPWEVVKKFLSAVQNHPHGDRD